jgi:uncharacterized membrane protein
VGLVLMVATIATGLVAGLFSAFAHAVMPGLGRSGDVVFVEGFRAIDAAISNPWFGVGFVGAPLSTVVAAALQVGPGGPALAWICLSVVLQAAVLAITVGVHLPLNRHVQAAGAPERSADLARVRQDVEQRWVRWNVVRAVLSTGAFGCVAWALALHDVGTTRG